MTETTTCSTKRCTNEARVAISTKRPSRDRMYSVIDFDDRIAPKAAHRYCKTCAIDLISGLIKTLVPDDTNTDDVP